MPEGCNTEGGYKDATLVTTMAAKNFSIRLPEEVDQAIRDFAKEYNTPIGKVVERALRVYLEEKAGVQVAEKGRQLP